MASSGVPTMSGASKKLRLGGVAQLLGRRHARNRHRFLELARMSQCAVSRRVLSVGESPTRQLLFQPVAIGTAVEETKRTKLPVERVLRGLGEQAGHNVK